MADNDANKRVNNLEVGQAELRIEQKEMRQDITEIKTQVSNHLPTQIAEVQASVDEIAKRHQTYDAIMWFISLCFKVTTALVGAMWVGLQIVKALHK
jgi:hypothetical protein